jgi:peptidyl-prolyl cis-trans isomerase SurA
VAKDKFNRELLKLIGYKRNPKLNYQKLISLTDSFISGKENRTAIGDISQRTPLHSFGNEVVRVGEWLKFVRDYKATAGEYNIGTYSAVLDKFTAQSAVDYYRKRLDQFSPEYRYQVQEFKDGNVLFEVMERNVWNKASADSAGLLKYYQQHKSKYTWEPSADAYLITAPTKKLALEVSDLLHKGEKVKSVLDKYLNQVQYDSGRYELGQIPVLERTNFQPGLITAPVVNEADGSTSFAVILKLYPGNLQRTFEESRGLVINDYQSELEEKWIAELKKKYPVKVNEQVFASLTR